MRQPCIGFVPQRLLFRNTTFRCVKTQLRCWTSSGPLLAGLLNDRVVTPSTPPPKRHPYAQWAPDARALDLVGDKWTLLIVRDLAPGPRRFVELQRVLPGISTEQLRSRLNRMVADGLLTRQRYREVPPRVDYELTPRSRELLPVLGALTRWGLEWAWTAPREGEAIDIGAILRVTPGLISTASGVSGTAELSVTRPDGVTCHYAITPRARRGDHRRTPSTRRGCSYRRQRSGLDRGARPRRRSWRPADHGQRALGDERARRAGRYRAARQSRRVAFVSSPQRNPTRTRGLRSWMRPSLPMRCRDPAERTHPS